VDANLRSALRAEGMLTRDSRIARAQEVRPAGGPETFPNTANVNFDGWLVLEFRKALLDCSGGVF